MIALATVIQGSWIHLTDENGNIRTVNSAHIIEIEREDDSKVVCFHLTEHRKLTVALPHDALMKLLGALA